MLCFLRGLKKKLEIHFSSKCNLLNESTSFWKKVVREANAEILSQMDTEICKSYLLSESSLFVYENHLIMITCGTTTLVKAAIYLAQHFGLNELESLIYERKNEYFPYQQRSDFYQDVKDLQGHFKGMKGKAYCFGQEDHHHLMLFHFDTPFYPPQEDRTCEILMHKLAPEVCQKFAKSSTHSERDFLRQEFIVPLQQRFPLFQKQEYFFKPLGYSLNALHGSHYYTLHVTPEEKSSYVSFECNYSPSSSFLKDLLETLTNTFRPKSFDVIHFHRNHIKRQTEMKVGLAGEGEKREERQGRGGRGNGDMGHIGENGLHGDMGHIGDRRHIGENGLQGDMGYIGDRRHIGENGLHGDMGHIGDRRHIGENGLHGDSSPLSSSKKYQCTQNVNEKLSCGYEVHFSSHFLIKPQSVRAHDMTYKMDASL